MEEKGWAVTMGEEKKKTKFQSRVELQKKRRKFKQTKSIIQKENNNLEL